MKKILFICTEGKNRSVTAANLYKTRYDTKSLALIDTPFVNRNLEPELEWADLIIVMEKWHADTIKSYYPSLSKEIIVLNIPDNYIKNDPNLIQILKESLDEVLVF